MHLLYTLFIALANNVDNISVRIAYSIRGVKISLLKNLWISIITFFISSFAALLGTFVSKLFNPNITPIISMILLVSIGLWIIFEASLKKESHDEFNSNMPESIPAMAASPIGKTQKFKEKSEINFTEATYLGIALSINNIGGGLSAGMIGLNSSFVGLFSALISFIALWVGNYITEIFNRLNLGKKANILAGIILILIGLKQIL